MKPLKRKTSDTPPSRLAMNLRHLMISRNMNEMSLANALNIPYMTIRRLTMGVTIDPRISTLMLISKYFNVDIDNLIYHTVSSHSAALPNNTILVPVLTWELLEAGQDIVDLDSNTWTDWQAVHLKNTEIHNDIFALKSRPSMYPRFQNETVFIIKPNMKLYDGDSVLVKMNNTSAVSLRELVIDPPSWRLHSYVLNSPPLEYDPDQHTILGVVVLTLFHNRKA